MSQEGLNDFQSSLSNLGAHPDADIIAMLTGFAEDLQLQNVKVLSILMNRIRSVDPTRKVPLLYLLDSIIKSRAKPHYLKPFAETAANLFLEVFQTVGDKDKLRMRRVLKTWREMKLLPSIKSEPVWVHINTWIMSNPDRVAVAEGKQRRSVSVPRPPVLSQVQGLQQRTGSMNSQLGQVGQLGPQQISQDPFHQFVHQQQLAMGLAPKSLSELQMINPGLIHSLHQAYAAARGTQQPPPNLSQLSHLSQTQHQPPTSSHSVPSLPIPTTTISPDVDDDASALLAMIGGAIDDDTEISVLPAALDTALDTTNTSSNESTVVSDDVTDLFAILEGATGGAGSSSSSFNNHHNIPICSANLSKAFQGNTAQLLQSLQIRDEERVVGPLYSGKQDEKTGHRFPNQPKYEAQISFNYHITQREKMLNQADLMRRWNLPFSHWIAQPSPYHTVGNEFIQYKPEQKMRDPYMTTDEAAKIAAGGGVIVGGEASLAAQVPPSLSELLSRTTNNIEGDLFDEKSNGDSNNQNNLENKMDTEGIYYIPVDELREHETKQCVVCQETFESVFDDAADRWVYKPTRRVPAGLLHSHCWTQESESFVNKTETSGSSSKKRSLDDEENENDSEEGEPSLKRTKT